MTLNQKLKTFFSHMWGDYCKFNPQAAKVYDSLSAYGESVVNDHVAFRTFSHPKINALVLAKHFEKYGYTRMNEYKFTDKKLTAYHFEHFDVDMPKVFISELDLSLVSDFIVQTVNNLAPEINSADVENESFMYSGRPWKASYETYQKLSQESEYASWVYAHGFRPNHFTVYVNHLSKLSDIGKLNSFLLQKGFVLNTSGGAIKGTPQDLLEQSSTLAEKVPVQFNEGVFDIPGCYYEFAKRYTLPNGKLFQGFVAGSADKIFESTYV